MLSIGKSFSVKLKNLRLSADRVISASMSESRDVAQGDSTNWSQLLSGVLDAVTPRAIKAIDRLLGAGIEIPAAWLEQRAERIKSQTKSFATVEGAVADKAGMLAASDPNITDRAMQALVRKEYRRQQNRETIAQETIINLRNQDTNHRSDGEEGSIDEDWLNVFERFAEDASTERMQGLWARVLAGEIRQPGAYSLRTLRFLSEFSQGDAVLFADICQYSLRDNVPKALARPEGTKDIRYLLQLEAAGLISGASGMGFNTKFTFDGTGHARLIEGNLALVFKGEPTTTFEFPTIGLTPLGVEIVSLIPGRDIQSVMRKFANAVRTPAIKSAFIGHFANPNWVNLIEELWNDQT
jgi:Protein of unknown function (DUF2806)